jgi:hypothetical protein
LHDLLEACEQASGFGIARSLRFERWRFSEGWGVAARVEVALGSDEARDDIEAREAGGVRRRR